MFLEDENGFYNSNYVVRYCLIYVERDNEWKIKAHMSNGECIVVETLCSEKEAREYLSSLAERK